MRRYRVKKKRELAKRQGDLEKEQAFATQRTNPKIVAEWKSTLMATVFQSNRKFSK